VEDLTKIVEEAIRATSIDHRPELEELRSVIKGKVGKSELQSTLKAQTQVLEELKKN
jgi:hypothetical protein